MPGLRLRSTYRLAGAVGLSGLVTGCSHAPPPIDRLASDVHVSIAGRAITLPFVALEDYAYQKASFSLDRAGDVRRARRKADDFLIAASDPNHPFPITTLTIVVGTYGWNDSDMRQRAMCPLLKSRWARSVCDDPWAAVQQALPRSRFTLVDLRALQEKEAKRVFNCVDGAPPAQSLPREIDQTVLVCRAKVASERPFYTAATRVTGSLVATWTVWGPDQFSEQPEAKAQREGEALQSFMVNALGTQENFAKLHSDACRLRRPGSVDGPQRSDCKGEPPSASRGVPPQR